MIQRHLAPKLLEMRGKYPVLFLTGPRQSGKTTLVKSLFGNLPYFLLEDPDTRQFALNDPRGFLANLQNGAVLDEVQRTPDLFSYLQGIVDSNPNVFFVLSGSQNFLLSDHISQSLAGRTSVQKLLPLSYAEMRGADIEFATLEDLLYQGAFPRIYDRHIAPPDFFPAYIETYVQRDVRLLKNIPDLDAFVRFMGLCAGRCGQLLSYQSLAHDTGISPNTAKSWISILQASYVVFLLQPYHNNYNKRIIKSPKLYFYDTGMVCSILGLNKAGDVQNYHNKGALFENHIITEHIKTQYNQGLPFSAWFWQDQSGKEIDLLMQSGNETSAVEIKSGKTFNPSFFQNLTYWQNLSGTKPEQCAVIYGGDTSFQTSSGRLISWREWEGKL
ncbi:MAG TPA: ATP-binding protein [Saprospiraceae bacterium]|nr:ATP-binding protein [Saprospiraceae bacterium]